MSAGEMFVVVWPSYLQIPAGGFDIFARPFSSAGTPLASEFQVNLHTAGDQVYPAVATDADGDFVVVWQSAGQDGSERGIFARAFSSAGSPSSNEFQVNSYTPNSQYFPALASESDGDFVVAWVSYGQDGSQQGVFAQRFAQGIALDIDGDGTTQPLTDGLLVLRFLFGFGDGALIAAAVDTDCTRCDAPAIEAYLDLITPLLNIDGNPLKDPLTDGLLVLRHLFAFSGSALVNGAVGAGCTRCDAPSIEAYLAELSG